MQGYSWPLEYLLISLALAKFVPTNQQTIVGLWLLLRLLLICFRWDASSGQ
jgi:hypothetical protein